MIQIIQLNIQNPQHQNDLLYCLQQYALDPMGGGEAISPYVVENLIHNLATRNDYFAWLAYDNNQAVGLLNAFESFSTFYAKPLLNIHDLAVLKSHRRLGIARQLMQTAESFARQQGYCKLTLEVLAENTQAKSLYQDLGYQAYQLSQHAGVAEFWQKAV
ncbi:GNAT family N-acetyltransferase [Catenovulum sediminis]|uniref:GNAT family N-acetyltransferase n=1 Tax=Catenovulum sediminis TaxID=1740262 RepID=UPI00117EFF2D|nr:GNAT family N-acetyltransferase [Catenovulum sediminis]